MIKDIPNFSGYFADVDGNIYSSKKGNRVKKLTPQFQKQWGYYSLRLIADCGNKKHMTVHRLVAITYLPNTDNLPEVNHKNGNKTDNRLSNLEWMSKSDNIKHAYQIGMNCVKGVLNGRSTLEEHEVLEIYNKLYQGVSTNVLMAEYDTSRGIVSDIKRRAAWSHLTKDLPDITIKVKSKTLPENIVRFICENLERGLTPTKILTLCLETFGEGSVRIDNIYDIKRRRGFKNILSDYNW